MKTIVKRSRIHGKGLFATRPIFEGEIIGRCEARELAKGATAGSFTLFLDDDERKAMNILCKHRFINHSDEPNVAYCDDLSIIALDYISRGEELTHDYSGD